MSVLLTVMVVYAWALREHHTEGACRAMAFIVLILANLSLIVTSRSWSKDFGALLTRPNKALKWVLLGALGFLGSAVLLPPVQRLFHFQQLHGNDLVACVLAGIMSILWFDLLKKTTNQAE